MYGNNLRIRRFQLRSAIAYDYAINVFLKNIIAVLFNTITSRF